METTEKWKIVKGFEDYQVSDFGRVKSLKFGRELILQQYVDNKGYCYVSLSHKKNVLRIAVHQLMAITFLNHIPCGLLRVVDHKDNNPSNNYLSNLQIVTNRVNSSKDRVKFHSVYTGVTFNKNMQKFVAFFKIKSKRYHLGYFHKDIDAHNKYVEAVSNFELYGIVPKTRTKKLIIN